MARLRPRRHRSEEKGPRQGRQLPEGIRATDIDRMAAMIQEILASSYNLEEPELALLNHVELLSLRVKAFGERNQSLINHLNKELFDSNKALSRLGFKKEKDIIPLNLWIKGRIAYQEGVIEELLKQVEQKLLGAK